MGGLSGALWRQAQNEGVARWTQRREQSCWRAQNVLDTASRARVLRAAHYVYAPSALRVCASRITQHAGALHIMRITHNYLTITRAGARVRFINYYYAGACVRLM